MDRGCLIDVIAGARPNFMKIAPIIREIQRLAERGSPVRYRLVHTGQHYDVAMSGSFFEQLNIPEPDVNLDVRSGSQASQTAAIMLRYESLLVESPSDVCVVVGDVTSTMACAITAQKQGIPVAHVEGGIRSGDWSMPEEINRLVTDSVTNWFFTTSIYANENLRHAGVGNERIYFVGNTMIDTLLSNLPRTSQPEVWNTLRLSKGGFLVLTLHRPSNVDNPEKLLEAIHTICKNARELPVIFPAHPRTAAAISNLDVIPRGVHLIDPQPYLQFLHLVRNAKAVITDSGGITEEATVLGIPCLTLRDSTERPETVDLGTNVLVGPDVRQIEPHLDRLFEGKWKTGTIPEKWDGRAAERIVSSLVSILGV